MAVGKSTAFFSISRRFPKIWSFQLSFYYSICDNVQFLSIIAIPPALLGLFFGSLLFEKKKNIIGVWGIPPRKKPIDIDFSSYTVPSFPEVF